ncbi:unnamed protein product [Sphagnum compactum]
MDGSETLQDGINTNEPSNGDGQGATPAGGQANHPVTPLGEQGHEKPNQSGEAPFNEALVDDNHSNSDGGVAASKMMNLFIKTANEEQYADINSPEVAAPATDSPQTGEKNNNKEDGHAFEELSDPYSLQDVINNTPHPSNEADLPMAEDPGIVDTNKDREDVNPNATPDIYKGDIMSPDENQVKHDKATHDFGTGDQFADTRIEEDAPLQEAIPAAVIDLYASLPITAWTIECENPHVRKFMEDMCKRLKLREILQGIALEYFMIGDVFVMAELDEEHKTWKRLVPLNPDQVEVRRNVLADTPVIELIPDDDIKKIVFDRNPRELYDYFRMFLPDVVQAVKAGKNIPIDPAHITHLRHMPTPYGVYGTPLLKRIFKTLMYKEMLRRAQFVIAERYVTPLKIFKLEREMIAGLGVSRAFLDGLGPTYANASIGDPDTDEEFLIKVEFKWEALRLQDEASRQNALMALRQSSMLSAKTLLNAYHINPETEAVNLTDERDTIFDMNRILARQIKVTQETQMGLQYQMQQLMGGAAGMMGGGMPGQGSPPALPGQQGATPPPGGSPMTSQMNPMQSMPQGSFAPAGGTGMPAMASQNIIHEMLKEVRAALREQDDD